jgi:hypothetical protein
VLDKTQFWFLMIVTALAAVFVIVNMTMYENNRAAQMEVAARQQYIQQTIQLQVLYNEMVRAIADLAVRNHDAELAGILRSQGIGITAPANAAPPAAADTGTTGTK